MSSLGRTKLFLLIIMFSLIGCLESRFQLAEESRLPKWFIVPEEMDRGDLYVRMDLYSTFRGGKAVFKLCKKGKLFCMQKAMYPDIGSVQLKSPPEGFPKRYPKYMVVTINGITDIIELRKMEPVFYMTDDPAIWEELCIEKK